MDRALDLAAAGHALASAEGPASPGGPGGPAAAPQLFRPWWETDPTVFGEEGPGAAGGPTRHDDP